MAITNPPMPLSRRTALAGLGAGSLAAALAARGASAQQAATDPASHPIVGVWRNVTGPETPPGLRTINAIHGDGTLTGVHSFGGAGVGAWHPVDARAVRWIIVYFNIADTPGQFVEGTVTVAGSLTVDEAGTTLTEETTVEIRAADDAVVASFPFTTTFARVPAEAPPAAGTPVP